MSSPYQSLLISLVLLLSNPVDKSVHAEESNSNTSTSVAVETTSPDSTLTSDHTVSSNVHNSSPLYLRSTDIAINIQATLAPIAVTAGNAGSSADLGDHTEGLQFFRGGDNETNVTPSASETLEPLDSGKNQGTGENSTSPGTGENSTSSATGEISSLPGTGEVTENSTSEAFRSTQTSQNQSEGARGSRENPQEAQESHGQEDQRAEETNPGRLQNDTREELQGAQTAAQLGNPATETVDMTARPIEPSQVAEVNATVASTLAVPEVITSVAELQYSTNAPNTEEQISQSPIPESLSLQSSDISKLMDEPMLADTPHSELEGRNKDMIGNIRDSITNIGDKLSQTSKESIDQGGDMMSAANTSDSREKTSINNENLNPIPPSNFEKDASKGKDNTLVNNIRQSVVNVSEAIMATGTQAEFTSEMAQIKKPGRSPKVKIGAKGQSPADNDVDGSNAAEDTTVHPEAEKVPPLSSSSEAYGMVSSITAGTNESSNAPDMSSGMPARTSAVNTNVDKSITSSTNISSTLRNLTNSQLAHSLVNQTVQRRESLKARNAGSRPVLSELQRSGWLTLVVLVSMTSRF